MVTEKMLEAASKYKRDREVMNPWTYYYSINEKRF